MLSLYRSLLTGKKTMLVKSIGQCGHLGYREIQIVYKAKAFHWTITNGYKTLASGTNYNGLKSCLSMATFKASRQV